MSKKFSFYLVKDDGTVEGTDNGEIAEVAGHDGSSLVINVASATATYDGDTMLIDKANPDDWLEDDRADDAGEGDDE